MNKKGGFTLVELLVVIAVIAILVVVALPTYQIAMQHAYSAGCASRMRALGIGFMAYTSDNNGQFPPRATGPGIDKWPVLLLPYVSNPQTYVDPGDPIANKVPLNQLVSNSGNNSSFFFNGFNDLGFYTNPNLTVALVNLNDSSNLILLGQKVHNSKEYYMDFVEGNENDVLNKQAYFGGSNYVFADGSARFMLVANYDNTLWLINKNYSIPTVPGH